jgi:hypothetical protein
VVLTTGYGMNSQDRIKHLGVVTDNFDVRPSSIVGRRRRQFLDLAGIRLLHSATGDSHDRDQTFPKF